MSRIEEAVIAVLLVFFIALLSLIAVTSGIRLLWIPTAMLGWAFLIHVGIA
jgi:hypothetical protein